MQDPKTQYTSCMKLSPSLPNALPALFCALANVLRGK
jgi:hypothetical protein